MRITGTRLVDLAAASTTKSQNAVGDAAAQLSSGLKVTVPSDDPTAWIAAQRTKLQKALSEGNGAAVASSRERLVATDAALGQIGDLVSQTRSLAVQGASDTYSPEQRAGLGAQIRGLFQSALDSANARGNDGEYLLAGSASMTAPFGATGTYAGDATTRALPSSGGTTSAVTIAGSDLTAARGVDVLPLMDRVATALTNNDMPALLAAMPDLDTAIKQISSARSRGGAAMNVLDEATQARTLIEQNMQESIARLVEVDTVAAATELAKTTQSLEVSRAVSSRILELLRPSA